MNVFSLNQFYFNSLGLSGAPYTTKVIRRGALQLTLLAPAFEMLLLAKFKFIENWNSLKGLPRKKSVNSKKLKCCENPSFFWMRMPMVSHKAIHSPFELLPTLQFLWAPHSPFWGSPPLPTVLFTPILILHKTGY